MPFGPSVAELPTTSGKSYIDLTAYNRLLGNFSDWADNVNAGNHSLSNLAALNFNAGGSISSAAAGLTLSTLGANLISSVSTANPVGVQNVFTSQFTGSTTSDAFALESVVQTPAAFSSSVGVFALNLRVDHGDLAGGGSGNVTSAVGLRISSSASNGATIGTSYGILINALAGATKYGIYDASGSIWNNASGSIGIGSGAGTRGKLEILSGAYDNAFGSTGTGSFVLSKTHTVSDSSIIAGIGQVSLVTDYAWIVAIQAGFFYDPLVLNAPGAPVTVGLPAAQNDGYLSMGNGLMTFWVDESGNNLKFRVKYSTGTLKTGTLALT